MPLRAGRCRATSRPRDVAALAAVAVLTFSFLAASHALTPTVLVHAQQGPSALMPAAALHVVAGHAAAMATPQTVPSAFMPGPQPLSAAQAQVSALDFDRLSSTWAGRRLAASVADAAFGPQAGTDVAPLAGASQDASTPATILQRVAAIAPSTFGLAVRMVAEPSVAVGDAIVWVTGNWFAARSADAGATWSYVNPYADFPTFTSDQDTAYDPQRHLFVWYRQGGLIPGRVENSFRLSVSRDGAASWCGFTVRPSEVDPSWNTFLFDYPHLALTDNYLYLSSMLLVTGGGFASPRMVLLRMSLDDLATCSAFRYVYWTADEGWSWTPIENGAKSVMYLGDTLDAGAGGKRGAFRLYVQPEATTTLSYVDRPVPAWTYTERNGLCAVSGGGNPCARTDQRITSGWVRERAGRTEAGFIWNVREGGGFPHPYIDGVTFDLATLAVTGRPMLWDSKCAWQYGATAPNGPDLGIAAFYFCASQPPAHAVGFATNGSGPTSWSMVLTRAGEVPTSALVWGDYIRVRADGGAYLATGYTIGTAGAEPFLVSFARRPALAPEPDSGYDPRSIGSR